MCQVHSLHPVTTEAVIGADFTLNNNLPASTTAVYQLRNISDENGRKQVAGPNIKTLLHPPRHLPSLQLERLRRAIFLL